MENVVNCPVFADPRLECDQLFEKSLDDPSTDIFSIITMDETVRCPRKRSYICSRRRRRTIEWNICLGSMKWNFTKNSREGGGFDSLRMRGKCVRKKMLNCFSISDSFHLLFLWMIYFGYSSIESRRSVYSQSYNFSNAINKRCLFNGSGKARSPLSTLGRGG